MPDPLREKRVELILQQLEELPTLPAVAIQVLEVTASDTSDAQQVVALISSDQSLTARLLQLVHRADLGVRGDVNTVERAVVLLGFEAVRSMVLALSVFQTLSRDARPDRHVGHFSRDEFWKHSIAVACCAELLAEYLKADGVPAPTAGGEKGLLPPGAALSAPMTAPPGPPAVAQPIAPSEAFVAGLLHDLGKVALDTALPKSFDRVVEAADLLRGNIADLERNIIGLDHMVVGKRLAERWGLPAPLREVIWLHGQLPNALPQTVRNPRLVNLVTLADLIAREQHLGYSGNYAFAVPKASLVEALGLPKGAVEGVLQQLIGHIEPRAKALGLGQANTSELYLEALTRANRELGRVSNQLAAKNRRLAIRARFFDALSHFQSELRPDSNPQTVLEAVGQTAVAVLNVSSCAVFSALPGVGFAETMLFDQHGDVFESTVIECPRPIAKPPNGDGPVLAAGDELEWLLAAISPRLAEDRRYWVCLEADGVCVGGVVWGSKPGESQRLGPQVQELSALAVGWSLALRTAQIREEARTLAEQLAEANRRLQSAQEEIQRGKTIIAVGEMAAGAAHEMNNPLAVISGRAQVLALQLTDPKQKHAAKLIEEQAHRVSEIITELMEFAKPVPAVRAETDLAEVVERALHEAKFGTDPVDRTIEVTIADIPPVVIDAKQVTAALIEVMSNAIQATDESSGQVSIHAGYDAYSGRVVMTVADNGRGMDEETLRRAFDPFFSSKPAGRRRGMGLAKALRWVQSSGGSIRLESRLGKGTRSIVLLPAALTAPVEEAPARRAAQ